MSFGVDIKRRIQEDAAKAVEDYKQQPRVATDFGEPVIGYASARNPILTGLDREAYCDHPKSIFRPAGTIVVYYIPYGEAVRKAQENSVAPSKEWITAHREAGLLTALINGAIRRALDTVGRITSGTNTPADWQQDVFRPEWDHRIPAYLAGLGEIGPNGSFFTEVGPYCKLGSCLTDGDLELSWPEAPTDYDAFLKYYLEKNEAAPDADVCPAKAVKDGRFDHAACQEYCRAIYDYTPSPELCGKCYLKK